jgi:hypothetical protein
VLTVASIGETALVSLRQVSLTEKFRK